MYAQCIGTHTSICSHSAPVGEAVESRFGGGTEFYPSKISAVNEDGTYVVAYDDGDNEPSVRRLRIRRPGEATPALVEGMQVEARHEGGIAAYEGVISKGTWATVCVCMWVDGAGLWLSVCVCGGVVFDCAAVRGSPHFAVDSE